ncbi:hypothetical protein, partial [Endozoicomonas sp. ALC013]|uniref:hypothetical protein n=1 Tax=Endozoicomonas sp. ALC013 TaxID=3403076 RepID=UPI003BB64B22
VHVKLIETMYYVRPEPVEGRELRPHVLCQSPFDASTSSALRMNGDRAQNVEIISGQFLSSWPRIDCPADQGCFFFGRLTGWFSMVQKKKLANG